MARNKELQQVEVQSVEELRKWFEKHCYQEESIWVVTYKKHVKGKYVSIKEVLDEVLCFGWMDGRRKKLDEDRTMQLLSPRRVEHWAKTYKDRVAELENMGRMHERGKKAVEDAKKSGMWNFMDDVDALIKPDDLIKALQAHPPALKHFDAFPPSSKRNILRWIKIAKKAETRAKRIQETAELAANNKRAAQG